MSPQAHTPPLDLTWQVRRIVLPRLADLVEVPGMFDAHRVMRELFRSLYSPVAEAFRANFPAHDVDQARYDASQAIPRAVLHLIAPHVEEPLLPEYLRQYVTDVLEMLNRRIDPTAPQHKTLWHEQWLSNFDRDVRCAALRQVATWQPPPEAKHRYDEAVVSSEVLRHRRELWGGYELAKRAEEIDFIPGRRKRAPWSQTAFCDKHRVNPREFRRWIRGYLRESDRCVTSGNIEQALKAEIDRMKLAGFTGETPGETKNTPRGVSLADLNSKHGNRRA